MSAGETIRLSSGKCFRFPDTRYESEIEMTLKQAKELAATKALVWPLFYTGVFYLLFVGLLTILLGRLEKKLNYFRS